VEGTIIAVGKGKTFENDDIKSLEVKKGDRVLFGKHSGTKITLEGEDYFVIREENIFGIIY
jgi:chaperonin GroES